MLSETTLQLGLALLLAWATVMFLWGRLRYDLIAILTLLGAVFLGAVDSVITLQ